MGGPFVSRGAWPGGLRADCLGSTHHSMPPNSNRRRDDEPEIFFLQYEEIVGQKGTEGEGQENYLQAHERERVALKSSKQHCRSCISFVSAGRQTDCFIASGWRPYDMFNIRFSSLKEIRRHLIHPPTSLTCVSSPSLLIKRVNRLGHSICCLHSSIIQMPRLDLIFTEVTGN